MNFSDLQQISNEMHDLLDEMEKDGSAEKFRQAEALAKEAQESPAFKKLVTEYNCFRVPPTLTPQQLLQNASTMTPEQMQQVLAGVAPSNGQN